MLAAPHKYKGAIQRMKWLVAQAEELQRLEAERAAILTRRAPRLLQHPTADGADAHGATGGSAPPGFRVCWCKTICLRLADG